MRGLSLAGRDIDMREIIRCQDCLMFGANIPGEYDCGNCRSKNTEVFVEKGEYEKVRQQAIGKFTGIRDRAEGETKMLSRISKLRFVLKLLRDHHIGTTLTVKGSEHDSVMKEVDGVLMG